MIAVWGGFRFRDSLVPGAFTHIAFRIRLQGWKLLEEMGLFNLSYYSLIDKFNITYH
jgi:hypothetical protein